MPANVVKNYYVLYYNRLVKASMVDCISSNIDNWNYNIMYYNQHQEKWKICWWICIQE